MTNTAITVRADEAAKGIEAGTHDDASARRALAARAAVAQGVAQAVPSPCVSVCRMEAASGLCAGCLRTLDEIAGWSRMEDACKRRVWRAIELRTRLTPSRR